MKTTKLMAIVGIALLMFTSCGSRKKDRCPSMGQKTFQVR